MEPNDEASLVDALSTTEHEKLSDVIHLVSRLEQLRARGLTTSQMAERIRLSHPEVPGGGQWSAKTVERVLELVDGNRPPAGFAPIPPSGPVQRSVPPPNGRQNPQYAPAGHRPPEASRQPQPLRTEPRVYHQRPGELAARESEAQRRSALVPLLSIVGALIAGSLIFGLYQGGYLDRGDGSNVDAASAADDSDTGQNQSESTIDSESADTASGEAQAGGTGETDAANQADSMTIVIEPSGSESSGMAAASATIRNDGKLYVEGGFRSETEADRFITDAANVFGAEAIVRQYVIDPSAPDPKMSDIALEKPVLFETGSAVIDPEYIPFLEACGDVLKLNPQIIMSISAITDSVGDEQLNLELSQQRADAIVDFYRSIKIADEQLLAVGLGESKPVADNGTAEGRKENRRAMLELLNVISSS